MVRDALDLFGEYRDFSRSPKLERHTRTNTRQLDAWRTEKGKMDSLMEDVERTEGDPFQQDLWRLSRFTVQSLQPLEALWTEDLPGESVLEYRSRERECVCG